MDGGIEGEMIPKTSAATPFRSECWSFISFCSTRQPSSTRRPHTAVLPRTHRLLRRTSDLPPTAVIAPGAEAAPAVPGVPAVFLGSAPPALGAPEQAGAEDMSSALRSKVEWVEFPTCYSWMSPVAGASRWLPGVAFFTFVQTPTPFLTSKICVLHYQL